MAPDLGEAIVRRKLRPACDVVDGLIGPVIARPDIDVVDYGFRTCRILNRLLALIISSGLPLRVRRPEHNRLPLQPFNGKIFY
jgi:hypothetical protein